MSYCSKCGAYIPEGEQSCLACGYRDSSAMGNFSAENNKKRMSIGSGTNSGSPGRKLVIRYSSKRRSGDDGAVRHLSSKRQAPQTGAAESEENGA